MAVAVLQFTASFIFVCEFHKMALWVFFTVELFTMLLSFDNFNNTIICIAFNFLSKLVIFVSCVSNFSRFFKLLFFCLYIKSLLLNRLNHLVNKAQYLKMVSTKWRTVGLLHHCLALYIPSFKHSSIL